MIAVQQVDITSLEVDAIVNAAGRSLRGGGGVDGAVHNAAGPLLLKACIGAGPCEPGTAKITPGFRLPAKWVIHAVGPRWRGGQLGEPGLLASCYRRSMELAREYGIRSLAFPAISCGVYGYPVSDGAAIAVREIRHALSDRSISCDVIFACPEQKVFDAFVIALGS